MGWFHPFSIAMLDYQKVCNMLISSYSLHKMSSGAESEYALFSNILVRMSDTKISSYIVGIGYIPSISHHIATNIYLYLIISNCIPLISPSILTISP